MTAKLSTHAIYAKQEFRDKLTQHEIYIRGRGEGMPEVRDWRWPSAASGLLGGKRPIPV
jgi:xylulose-5-phosphate/fructose-6-phosphate phosphoketolase